MHLGSCTLNLSHCKLQLELSHVQRIRRDQKYACVHCPYKIPTYLPNIRVQSRIWKTFNGKNIVFRLSDGHLLTPTYRGFMLTKLSPASESIFQMNEIPECKKSPLPLFFWASVVSSSNCHSSVAMASSKKVRHHSLCLSFSPQIGGAKEGEDCRPTRDPR